jgi:hypothetical protein
MQAKVIPTTGDGASLAPVPLELELGGRLRNIGRPKHWYMAIAESIKNSMDAIEDANQSTKREGWIEVKLERISDLASAGATRPVKHLEANKNRYPRRTTNRQEWYSGRATQA